MMEGFDPLLLFVPHLVMWRVTEKLLHKWIFSEVRDKKLALMVDINGFHVRLGMWLLRVQRGLTAARGLKQKEGQQEARCRRSSLHPAAPGDTEEEERGRRCELAETTKNNASSSLCSSQHSLRWQTACNCPFFKQKSPNHPFILHLNSMTCVTCVKKVCGGLENSKITTKFFANQTGNASRLLEKKATVQLQPLPECTWEKLEEKNRLTDVNWQLSRVVWWSQMLFYTLALKNHLACTSLVAPIGSQ